jgi:uncharacterized membrane protein YccF (DUF307 family)
MRGACGRVNSNQLTARLPGDRGGAGPVAAPNSGNAIHLDRENRGPTTIRALLNVIWLVFGGLWMAIAYVIAAIICFLLIITIPFGVAAMRIAGYVLWPFGRTIEVRRNSGLGSLIGNAIWIIFFGWWLALGHLLTGIAMCLTIIGLPLGVASFKIIPITLMPLGTQIVPVYDRRDGAGW